MSAPLWLNPAWNAPAPGATIVFVHGAIVDGWEMIFMRRRLERLGYRTFLFQYRSMMRGIDENAALFAEYLNKTPGETLHVVGHSMGGVLLRQVFEQIPDPRPGRLIAIGSPLLDCWVGHRFEKSNPFGRLLIGKTVYDHIHRQNNPVWQGERELGVIAGTYPFGVGRVFFDLPPGTDGIVLWDETRLQGLRDHVTINLNHFGMLLSRRCTAYVARFLATGQFTDETPGLIEAQPVVAQLT